MRSVLFAFTCAAFSGYASSMQKSREQTEGNSMFHSSNALASLLLSLSPTAVFNPSSPGVLAAPVGSFRIAQAPQLIAELKDVDRRLFLLRGCVCASACLMQPRQADAISATTMAGKSKPELGVILVDAPQQSGSTISGELVLNGGIIANVAFETPWKFGKGGYYDIEANTKEGDAAFVSVRALPAGETLSTVPKSFFTKALLGVQGRYGSYGAPSDSKVKSDTKTSESVRKMDVVFTILSPGGKDVEQKGTVTALTTAGSNDVIMLMGSTSINRWAGVEKDARQSTDSFRITGTRKTSLQAIPSSDYRDKQKDRTLEE